MSRFLSLPPELRAAIHRLVVVNPKDSALRCSLHNTRHLATTARPFAKDGRCPCSVDRSISGKDLATYQHLHGPSQPALSMTCHELRTEVLPIFYGENRILLGPPGPREPATPLEVRRSWWLSSPPFQPAALYMSHASINTQVWVPRNRHLAHFCCGAHRFEDFGGGVQFTIGSRFSGPHAGMIKLDISGEQADRRCYCQLRAFVEGLNARERLSTETLREASAARLLAFVRWAFETMNPLLRRHHDRADDCRLCGKEGCTLLLSAITR